MFVWRLAFTISGRYRLERNYAMGKEANGQGQWQGTLYERKANHVGSYNA